jgi:hypothetical protein
MNPLLLLISSHYAREIVADCAAVSENYAAEGRMLDDIARAVEERKGHREFSQFTPREGRA